MTAGLLPGVQQYLRSLAGLDAPDDQTPPTAPDLAPYQDEYRPSVQPADDRNPDLGTHDPRLRHPLDQREPGELPYDATDADGLDRTNDPLMEPSMDLPAHDRHPFSGGLDSGYKNPDPEVVRLPMAMYRQPINQPTRGDAYPSDTAATAAVPDYSDPVSNDGVYTGGVTSRAPASPVSSAIAPGGANPDPVAATLAGLNGPSQADAEESARTTSQRQASDAGFDQRAADDAATNEAGPHIPAPNRFVQAPPPEPGFIQQAASTVRGVRDRLVSAANDPAAVDVFPGFGVAKAARAVQENSEPAGGADRMGARILEINRIAARDQGRDDLRAMHTAAEDPAWRAAHPDLAAEYDDLWQEYGLTVAGQTGDAPKFVRQGAADAYAAAEPIISRGVQAVKSAAEPIIERGRQAVANIGEGIARNAERTAAADVRMAEQGGTAALGTFGPTPNGGGNWRKPTEAELREQVGSQYPPIRGRINDQVRHQLGDQSAEMLADSRFPRDAVNPEMGASIGPMHDAPPDTSGRMNAGFGTLPDSTSYRPAGSAGEMVRRIGEADMVAPSTMLGIIGDRPEYLDDVASFMLEQRAKVTEGRMTPRDVAKAYFMTVASQGSDAISRRIIEAKVPGFKIPDQYLSAGGRDLVRPEEAAAAWLSSAQGKAALDAIEQGQYLPELWSQGAAVRRAFGDDRFRTTNVFSERAPINPRRQFNMTNLSDFADQFNRAAQAGDLAAVDQLSQRLNGVGAGKLGFIKHALGFGETPTIDAVEINAWLTGQGSTARLNTPAADMVKDIRTWLKDRSVGEALRDRITSAFDEMNARMTPEQKAGLPDEIFNHVLHHWIWDRMKGTATTHAGFYDAMRTAMSAGTLPPTGQRPGVWNALGRTVNDEALNAAGGAFAANVVSGDVIPDPNDQRTPQERTRDALIHGAVGAGLAVGARHGLGALRRAEGGALATLGPVPPERPRYVAGKLVPPVGDQGLVTPSPLTGPIPTRRAAAAAEAAAAAGVDQPARSGGFPNVVRWYQARADKNAADMAAKGIQPLSWLDQVRGTAAGVGYSSMLGPGTFSVNMASNLLEPLYAAPKEVIRAGMRGNLREAQAMGAGVLTGLGHVGEAAWDAIRAQGRYAPSVEHPLMSQATSDPIMRAIHQALETPGRVWGGVPDAIFGTIGVHAGEAREAAQIATDQGLKGQKWKEYVNALLEGAERVRTSGLSQASDNERRVVEAGAAFGKRQAFQEELGKAGKLIKASTGGNLPVVGNLTQPFFKTPWNIMKRQGERSPLGFAMNTQTGFDKHYDAIVGSALVLGMGAAATAGLVTGSGPTDQGQKALMVENGWKPYSTLVGDTYIPNRMFGYAEGLLNAVGEAHDWTAYQKKGDPSRSIGWDALRRVGSLARQAPYAAGYASVADLVGQGPVAAAGDLATRFTPFAATSRNIATSMDDKQRTIDRGPTVPVLDELGQRWEQGTGYGRQSLPPAQGAFGQPKENQQQGIWTFFPATSEARHDPVVQQFLNVNQSIPQPRDHILVRNPVPQNQRQPGQPDQFQPALTKPEQREWNQLRGKALYDLTERMIRDPRWQQMAPGAQQQLLQGYLESAATTADGQMYAKIGKPEIDKRITSSLAAKKAS